MTSLTPLTTFIIMAALVVWSLLSAVAVGLFAMYASVLRRELAQTELQRQNTALQVGLLTDLLGKAKEAIAFRDGLLEYAARLLAAAGFSAASLEGAAPAAPDFITDLTDDERSN